MIYEPNTIDESAHLSSELIREAVAATLDDNRGQASLFEFAASA